MRRLEIESASAKPMGRNPFGEVAPGSDIIVQGFLQPAVLRYGQGGFEQRDPVSYSVGFGRLQLQLFADHVLCEKGPYHISDGSAVRMLLVHPDVCLVPIPSLGGALSDLPTYRRIGIRYRSVLHRGCRLDDSLCTGAL